MSRPIVIEHDIVTNKVTEREMNDAEFAEWEQRVAEQKAEIAALATKEEAKAAATAKLAALGLTTDDLKALGLGGN